MIAHLPNLPLFAIIAFAHRGVAQTGSALVWGTSGRRFKSSRPDLMGEVVLGAEASMAQLEEGVEAQRLDLSFDTR
jgi:hypothetical protein